MRNERCANGKRNEEGNVPRNEKPSYCTNTLKPDVSNTNEPDIEAITAEAPSLRANEVDQRVREPIGIRTDGVRLSMLRSAHANTDATSDPRLLRLSSAVQLRKHDGVLHLSTYEYCSRLVNF